MSSVRSLIQVRPSGEEVEIRSERSTRKLGDDGNEKEEQKSSGWIGLVARIFEVVGSQLGANLPLKRYLAISGNTPDCYWLSGE